LVAALMLSFSDGPGPDAIRHRLFHNAEEEGRQVSRHWAWSVLPGGVDVRLVRHGPFRSGWIITYSLPGTNGGETPVAAYASRLRADGWAVVQRTESLLSATRPAEDPYRGTPIGFEWVEQARVATNAGGRRVLVGYERRSRSLSRSDAEWTPGPRLLTDDLARTARREVPSMDPGTDSLLRQDPFARPAKPVGEPLGLGHQGPAGST